MFAHVSPHRPSSPALFLSAQLASAVAVQEAGGPFIPLRLGRKVRAPLCMRECTRGWSAGSAEGCIGSRALSSPVLNHI